VSDPGAYVSVSLAANAAVSMTPRTAEDAMSNFFIKPLLSIEIV
jgi:hypothetical protein